MESVNNKFDYYQLILELFQVWGRTLERILYIVLILGLIALNVLSLTYSVVHDSLYSFLDNLPIPHSFQNSPTERFKKEQRINAVNKKIIAANKHAAKEVNKKIVKRAAKTVAFNISSIVEEAIPYIGIAAIVAVTASDVIDACDNMKDMDELLKSMGLQENNTGTEKICGQEIPGKEQIKSSITLTKEQYNKIQYILGEYLNDIGEQSSGRWERFNEILGGTIDEILH